MYIAAYIAATYIAASAARLCTPKGMDRIQGYIDTPDTIWINTADTAECTGSVSIWINTGSIGRIAILSGCELYGAQAQASEHLTAL